MNRSIVYACRATLLTGSVLLAGCMATNPLADVTQILTNAVTSDSAGTPVHVAPIVLKIPNDKGIQQRTPAPYTTVIVRDVGFDSRTVTVRPDAMYVRLLHESLTPTGFIVHARNDNGVAGSGIRYSIGYAVRESSQGYEVTFTPTQRTSYQQGVIGRFPLPDFTDDHLRRHLTALQIVYKFEVDSPYNSDSVTANFMRNAEAKSIRTGWADPVTGKIYSSYYVSKLRGRDMTYTVQVFPYRNGSKAVVHAIVPGVETSPNTVDFGVLIKDARRMLEEVARS
jgi:hypothetical protein